MGATFVDQKIFGVKIRESANDGSDFSNPDTDYRILFLGEDGLLHLRDSAGTVTTPSGGLSDPMTTRGDLIIRNASNVTARLGRGSAGQVLTSDGTDLSWQTPSGGSSTPAAHYCRVKRITSSQAIASNTLVALQFNGEDFDTDTMHDTSTNNTRITIPSISGVTTGLWLFNSWGYTDNPNGRIDLAFKLNGGTDPIGFGAQAAAPVIGAWKATAAYVCSASDYIEAFVRETAGTANVIVDPGVSAYFEAIFLAKVS